MATSVIYAGARGDGEFGGVAAELVHPVAVSVQDHGDQQAEFPIAQDGDSFAGGNRHLIEDLAGGGERFQEYGAAGGEIVGEDVEVALRQGEEFGEGARVLDDSQHGAVGAMASQVPAAPFAIGTGQVDLAGHTLADEGVCIGFHHLGDEFVTGRSGEAVVAALQFEIGIADAAGQQAEEREALGTRRNWKRAGGDCAILQVNCEHALYNRASCLRN